MFLLGKIIHYLILPPGLIIVANLLIALLIMRKKYRMALALLLFATLGLMLLSTAPFSNLLLKPLEEACPVYKDNTSKATHIVLLGGGTVHHSPDEHGKGSLSPDSMKRLLYAYRIHRKTGLPLILSGGRVFDPENVESEAEIAERILLELGVKKNIISKEVKSRNTWENAALIKKNFKPRRVILVTSAYHMRRSLFCFTGNGIETVTAPTDFKARRIPHSIKTLLPNIRYFNNSYRAVKEYIGMLFYQIKY